jgi:hypothetical protein
LYRSIAYAVVKEDDGLGGGLVSMYESDVDCASAVGVSAIGAGEDAETWRQCLDVHLRIGKKRRAKERFESPQHSGARLLCPATGFGPSD